MDYNEFKFALIKEITARDFTLDELNNIKENIQNIKDIAKKGILEFTEKELNTMPKNIKKLLLLDKKRCRLRTRPSGKDSVSYEIRFRRDGYNISASGKTLELAKANFLSKCKGAAVNIDSATACNVPDTFNAFTMYYFDTFRAEKVTAATLQGDKGRYNKHLQPFFKEKALKSITPLDCKTLLDKIKAQGKGKTADELHSLLNVIFKSAIAHRIIDRNPLDIVLHTTHQRKSGNALTREEEQRLKTALKGSQYLTAFMIRLYCGLRPNELKTATIQDNFIIAQNSKRKNKKVEYKRIPIIKALKPYIVEDFSKPAPYTMREYIKKILPNHILYDLRTTFYTRCDEYGVTAAARDEFVGHSNGALTNAYRNLSNDYLIAESKKLDKWQ